MFSVFWIQETFKQSDIQLLLLTLHPYCDDEDVYVGLVYQQMIGLLL